MVWFQSLNGLPTSVLGPDMANSFGGNMGFCWTQWKKIKRRLWNALEGSPSRWGCGRQAEGASGASARLVPALWLELWACAAGLCVVWWCCCWAFEPKLATRVHRPQTWPPVTADGFVVTQIPSMLLGVLWLLSYHPRCVKTWCDGDGKNFLLLLVFYENIEFSITRHVRAKKMPRY